MSSSQPTERTEFMKKIEKGRFNKITYRYVKDPFILRMKIMIYRFFVKRHKNKADRKE